MKSWCAILLASQAWSFLWAPFSAARAQELRTPQEHFEPVSAVGASFGGDPSGQSATPDGRSPSGELAIAPVRAASETLPRALSESLESTFSTLAPSPWDPPVLPCACGCGIFEVGGVGMLPHGQGGMVWMEIDHMTQNHNWSGWRRASDSDNGDKELRTWFYRPGAQYMFSDSWGIEAEVPFAHRYFLTDQNFPVPPAALTSADWTCLGDVRVRGLYTGFFPDLSAGLDFGVKLPTGKWTEDPLVVDRDSQISSASTDLLLGGYYRTSLTPDGLWRANFQLESDLTVRSRDQYHPGDEVDGSASVTYNGLEIAGVGLIPVGQMLVSLRSSDRGAQSAQPPASGYQRLLLSPGFEIAFGQTFVYLDAEFPVVQHFRGDQLVASPLWKLVIGFNF